MLVMSVFHFALDSQDSRLINSAVALLQNFSLSKPIERCFIASWGEAVAGLAPDG
jgi:hypothetical protein